jgi:serine/threonine-protein kinase PknK
MDGVDADSGRLSRPRVPGYDSFELIGRGGFSSVWRARQTAYDRMVAVKILHSGIDDEAGRRRFERECTLMGRLTGHPNIVTVLDSGFLDDGHPFLAMTYCEHGSLADRVRSTGPIPAAEVTRIGVKIAGALDAAHQLGVLHRDVKPENILVTAFGEPALADFGISTARGAATVTAAYTPTHAAPEVLLGKPADVRTDAYNLGSTLYQLLRGESAFSDPEQTGVADFVDRVLHQPPPPLAPEIAPAALSAAIVAAMAKDPADRPQTLADFGRRLQDVQRGAGQPVTDMVLMGASPEAVAASATAAATLIAAAAIIPELPGATPADASTPSGTATVLPPIFRSVRDTPASGDATMLASRARGVETPPEPPAAAEPRKRHVRALVGIGAVVALAALLVVVPWQQVMASFSSGRATSAPATAISVTPTPSAISVSPTPSIDTPTPTPTPTPTSTPTPSKAPSSAAASTSKPVYTIIPITKIQQPIFAPASPPDLVATRTVGNVVRLVWNKSPTTSVVSYRVMLALNGGSYAQSGNDVPASSIKICTAGYAYCYVDSPAPGAVCYEIIAVAQNGFVSAASPKSCLPA